MLPTELPDAAALDLTRYSLATQVALHQLAVASYWGRRCEVDGYQVPSFSPEDAELRVVYFHSRWFVTWRDLAQPESAPPEDRQPLLLIAQSPDAPFGLSFSPC